MTGTARDGSEMTLRGAVSKAGKLGNLRAACRRKAKVPNNELWENGAGEAY